jgi:hypothetical protein
MPARDTYHQHVVDALVREHPGRREVLEWIP